MAFTSIPQADINLGRPLKQSLFQLIKDNFDDLNGRVANLELIDHVEVTVVDSTSIDLTLVGQEITAAVIPAGVSHNALADVQAAASGVTHGHITDGAQTIAGAKSFSSEVTVPTATVDTSAVNKGQMDTAIASASSSAAAAQAAINDHIADLNNPHEVNKTDVGLSNVDNVQQIPMSQKGAPSGVATLDANGKVTLSEIPDSILGQLEYKGIFDASGGEFPTSPLKGWYYIISVAGVLDVSGQNIKVEIGDWIVYNGTSWDKVDNTDAVSSVAGRTGNVELTKEDVGLENVDNTADIDKPISSATATALAGKSAIGHGHSSSDISDIQIDDGKFQFNTGSGFVTVTVGALKDMVFSAAVGAVAVNIAHGISDISKIVAQSASVKIGTELFIQGSVVGIGIEKFSVRINETNIIIDPFEDLGGETVRVHLSVEQ